MKKLNKAGVNMGKLKNKIRLLIYTAFLTLCFATIAAEAYALTLGSPTPSTRVTDTFRIRETHPVTGAPGRPHRGIDIGGTTPGVAGDPIYSTASGTVVSSGYVSGYGNYVRIQHADGTVSTAYGHLHTLGVSVGQTVSAGQQIGTMGNTGGSTGVHLHYEVHVRNPDTGEMVAVDPQMAAGQDLTDPDVARALIADAEAKLNGQAGATQPNANGAGGQASAAPSCSNDMLETGKQLKEASMNLEKGIIDQMVQKPPSVMEMSCLDQFGKMFEQEIGQIFSDTTEGLELLGEAMPRIFGDTQTSILGEVSMSLFGDRANSFGSAISSQLNSVLGGILGGEDNPVGYNCEVMNTLWNILQCEDIFNFNIPSLKDLIGGAGFMQDILPSSCSGKALYDGALQAAQRAFTDNGAASSGISPQAIDQLLRSW